MASASTPSLSSDQTGGVFQEMAEAAVAVNPCDNVAVSTQYFIGHLATAAANCTRECPMSTYQDTNQVCHECKVVACATCNGEGDVCKDCLIFHMRAEGRCFYLYSGIFGAIVLFAFIFFLCGVLRFCCSALLTPRNSGVLREVLSHRRRAKVHDYSLPGNPFYAYDDTNVRRQNISGIAPILYFRFVAFLVVLTILLVVGLTFGYFLPSLLSSPQENELAGGIGLANPEAVDMTFATVVHAGVVYLVCFFAIVRFVWLQDCVVKSDVEEAPHLRNYALVAEGLPKSARSPHEVKAFFESILGFEMEGVSIAYDHVEESEFVEDRISRTVEKADTHLGVYPSEFSGLESHAGDSQDGYVLDCLMCSGYAFVVFSREEDREFCLRRFAEIDRQVRQGSPVDDQDESDDNETSALLVKNAPRHVAPRLRSSTSTGPSRAVLFRGKFPIRVGAAPEPCGIQWQNFAVRRGSKPVRIAVSLLGALLVVMLVSAVVYAPAVLAKMSYLNMAAKGEPGRTDNIFITFEQAVVAFSIAIDNRILMVALRRAAELSGFLQKVNDDSVFAICAFCSVVFSTLAPLIVASIVASTEDTTVTKEFAVELLFETLWMNMLFTEIVGYLGPTWSFWSAYFWVRQSRYVSVREGEPMLTTAEFPLAARYVDMLHSLTLVLTMISISGRSLYTIAGQCLLLLYYAYVYFADKYMFLRLTRQTYYTSPKLDAVVHYLFVVPLAALFVYPFQHILFDSRPWINPLIFAGNMLVFLLIARVCQKCNEPHRELSDIPYVEVASLMPYNYFNTNLVHVLRAMHFPSIVVPPIYPYRPGKEYLQGGQFADYDDSVRLRETLMLLAKGQLKGMEDFGNPQDLG